jgi:hypothetical protein
MKTEITFEFEQLGDINEVLEQVQKDEGHCSQQIAYSSFHNTLTQINLTEKKIRSNFKLIKNKD